jgi:hypothetical protein
LRTVEASGFSPDSFPAGGVPAFGAAILAAILGGAAAVFDSATARGVDSAGLGDFNFFDGTLCDARAAAFRGFLAARLADFFAVALRVFAAGFLLDVFDGVRVAFPERDLGDFLRVFLDIRLPFVAFGGSTIGALQPLPGQVGIMPTAGQV